MSVRVVCIYVPACMCVCVCVSIAGSYTCVDGSGCESECCLFVSFCACLLGCAPVYCSVPPFLLKLPVARNNQLKF